MSNEIDNYVLAAGFAQFPKGTSIYENQKVVGCILKINIKTEIIAEANFTFISDTTNNFLASLVTGEKINNGIDHIISQVEKKVLFLGKKAVIQSIISAYNSYKENTHFS